MSGSTETLEETFDEDCISKFDAQTQAEARRIIEQQQKELAFFERDWIYRNSEAMKATENALKEVDLNKRNRLLTQRSHLEFEYKSAKNKLIKRQRHEFSRWCSERNSAKQRMLGLTPRQTPQERKQSTVSTPVSRSVTFQYPSRLAHSPARSEHTGMFLSSRSRIRSSLTTPMRPTSRVTSRNTPINVLNSDDLDRCFKERDLKREREKQARSVSFAENFVGEEPLHVEEEAEYEYIEEEEEEEINEIFEDDVRIETVDTDKMMNRVEIGNKVAIRRRQSDYEYSDSSDGTLTELVNSLPLNRIDDVPLVDYSDHHEEEETNGLPINELPNNAYSEYEYTYSEEESEY